MEYAHIIGVDEVGRGPLAGPVVACAIIIKTAIPHVTDSKKISEIRRKSLAMEIQTQCITYAYGQAEVNEIDTLNIHHATLLAMKRAIEPIQHLATEIVIDGCFSPKNLMLPCTTLIKGDLLHPSISAASILAKVYRDQYMQQYHQIYPQYGFDAHKGYGTPAHLQALKKYGPSAIHRRSFRPVQRCMP